MLLFAKRINIAVLISSLSRSSSHTGPDLHRKQPKQGRGMVAAVTSGSENTSVSVSGLGLLCKNKATPMVCTRKNSQHIRRRVPRPTRIQARTTAWTNSIASVPKRLLYAERSCITILCGCLCVGDKRGFILVASIYSTPPKARVGHPRKKREGNVEEAHALCTAARHDAVRWRPSLVEDLNDTRST